MDIWKNLLEWSRILSIVSLEVEELVEPLLVDNMEETDDMEETSSMLSVDVKVETLELDEESLLLSLLLV